MDDEERRKLAEKLDKDFESFLSSKIEESKSKMRDQSPQKEQTVDELYEELKQHPAFMTDFDETQPMSAAMEGLQALKYESDSNEDNALSYKEYGNKNFERKKYRSAIESYTAGIKCKPVDKTLNAILYTNRAAANYHIGNFLSSFNDCLVARRFKPDHMKAILRGVQCSLQRNTFQTAIVWCDEGLALSPEDAKLMELRAKADQLLRKQEKEKRKELAKQKKEALVENDLIKAIRKRNISLGRQKLKKGNAEGRDSELNLESLESCHPSRARVTLDAEGVLHWPVMFLYPEFGETDFIASFCENSRFIDHFDAMFSVDVEPPAWDHERHYTADSIQTYFEDRERETLHRVPNTSTLLSVLQNERFVVMAGTPNFYLLVKDSAFARQFLAKYALS